MELQDCAQCGQLATVNLESGKHEACDEDGRLIEYDCPALTPKTRQALSPEQLGQFRHLVEIDFWGTKTAGVRALLDHIDAMSP